MRETLADLIERARAARGWCRSGGPRRRVMNVTSRLGISPLGAYHALMCDREMYFDLVRTKRELDWSPRYSNAEMCRESYD